MELIIFKAGVRKLKGGGQEPEVDWQHAPTKMESCAIYSKDNTECVVF